METMKRGATFGSLLALSLSFCSAQTINFDQANVGSVPDGWVLAMTHSGGPPKWSVLKDSSAPSLPNVLAQTSNDSTAGRFPPCHLGSGQC